MTIFSNKKPNINIDKNIAHVPNNAVFIISSETYPCTYFNNKPNNIENNVNNKNLKKIGI
jgi:hypothetical protein